MRNGNEQSALIITSLPYVSIESMRNGNIVCVTRLITSIAVSIESMRNGNNAEQKAQQQDLGSFNRIYEEWKREPQSRLYNGKI